MAARLAQARAERERVTAALAELRRGPRSERKASARARLEGAVAALRLAELALRRQQELGRQRLSSEEALDRAGAQQKQALAERDAAAQQLAELERGATGEELLQAEQALARSAAAEREVQVALDRLDVRAPQAGRIDALPFEVGERPTAGAVVAVLLAGDAPYARVYVPEPLRSGIRPGTRATVYVDGRERPFPGTVRRVSADPVFTPYYALTEYDRRRLAYLAEVALDGAPELPAGLPVEVEFAPLP
jgi:HlyD family secretion protein